MKSKLEKKSIIITSILILVFISIQFIQPKEALYTEIEHSDVSLPNDIAAIFKTSCFDCHSNKTKLKWFDKVAPVSWLVASDVKKGRAALNFSDWDKLPTNVQHAKLYYSLNKILANEMPLNSYVSLHEEARISQTDIAKIKKYLISQTPRKITDSIQINVAKQQSLTLKEKNNSQLNKKIKAAPNGIEYIPNYRNWKAISTSDRFDNGTMRIIYGNDIAIKAIKENKTNPWPDGSTIAKVAWKEQIDASGNINTGEFLQVEFMIKDQKKYAKTKGWGWARWRKKELVPYGKTVNFSKECVRCHQPVKNNDYVFTIPLNLNMKTLKK